MAAEAGNSPCVLDSPKCRSKHQFSTKIGCFCSTLQSIYDMQCLLFFTQIEFKSRFLLESGFKSRFLFKSRFKSLFYSNCQARLCPPQPSKPKRHDDRVLGDLGRTILISAISTYLRRPAPTRAARGLTQIYTNLDLSPVFYLNLNLSPVFYSNLDLSPVFYSNLNLSHFFYSNLNLSHLFYSNLS